VRNGGESREVEGSKLRWGAKSLREESRVMKRRIKIKIEHTFLHLARILFPILFLSEFVLHPKGMAVILDP
jgi:hypothetical protein